MAEKFTGHVKKMKAVMEVIFEELQNMEKSRQELDQKLQKLEQSRQELDKELQEIREAERNREEERKRIITEQYQKFQSIQLEMQPLKAKMKSLMSARKTPVANSDKICFRALIEQARYIICFKEKIKDVLRFNEVIATDGPRIARECNLDIKALQKCNLKSMIQKDGNHAAHNMDMKDIKNAINRLPPGDNKTCLESILKFVVGQS